MLNRHNGLISATLGFLAMACVSTQASALVDAQFGLGRRNEKWDQDSKSSTTTSDLLKVAAHLDPIPLVPVSFGLALYSENWKVSETDQGLTSLKSYSFVPEITAWLPTGDFKPYARVGYSILSAYTGKAVVSTGAGTTTTGDIYLAGAGLHMGAGVEWSVPIVPMLSIFGELEYASETVKLAKDKVADIDISGSFKSVNMTSTAIIIGAKLGI